MHAKPRFGGVLLYWLAAWGMNRARSKFEPEANSLLRQRDAKPDSTVGQTNIWLFDIGIRNMVDQRGKFIAAVFAERKTCCGPGRERWIGGMRPECAAAGNQQRQTHSQGTISPK